MFRLRSAYSSGSQDLVCAAHGHRMAMTMSLYRQRTIVLRRGLDTPSVLLAGCDYRGPAQPAGVEGPARAGAGLRHGAGTLRAAHRGPSNSTTAVCSRWSSERDAPLQPEACVGRGREPSSPYSTHAVREDKAVPPIIRARSFQSSGNSGAMCRPPHHYVQDTNCLTCADAALANGLFPPKLPPHATDSVGRSSERAHQVSAEHHE